MAVRIEDAGFEIRDMIAWVYGSGFPKSLNVSKSIEGLITTGSANKTAFKHLAGEQVERGNWGIAKQQFTHGQRDKNYDETASATVLGKLEPTTPEAKQWQGWGTALKPSWESITVAQKSVQSSSEIEDLFASLLQQIKIQICQSPSLATTVEQILRSSPNGLNEELSIAQWIAEKSINTRGDLFVLMATLQSCSTENTNWSIVSSWLNILEELYKAMRTCTIETKSSLIIDLKTLKLLEWESIFQSIIHAKDNLTNGLTANVWNAESLFSGLRLRLKIIHELFAQEAATSKEKHLNFAPNCSPIIMSRKPLIGTVAENVLQHGTGAINVDGGRVGTSGARNNGKKADSDIYGKYGPTERMDYGMGRWPANFIHDGSEEATDLLGASARFFYCAKASKADRGENHHPTVKPTDLMRYLCRLVTPPNGIVLDPFNGSGSTGCAAVLEGFQYIGIEREAEYIAISEKRIQNALERKNQVPPKLF
jgi:DNA modification methylase